METAAILPVASTSSAAPSVGGLTADDFFKLLITQLTNQDPLEPTSNQELMQQISAIRDIDLSTTLVESLKTLTSQQRFAAAPALMGKYVTAAVDPLNPELAPPAGIVVGVRYQPDGQILLQLDTGAELPLDRIESVAEATTSADSLIGMSVTGISSADPTSIAVISGIVTEIRTDATGRVTLELDTGEALALTDLLSTEPGEGATL
ncbi:MAG: hypothetical protein IID37_04330 [Planctomycetes bacterium]|nr:hypothetical protein [Planctomycetota bacterium]